MKRYAATLYRGKWLYLAVLVIMLSGAAVGARFLFPPQYTSTARIWVDGQLSNSEASMGLTAAKKQQETLEQLIETDSFMTEILNETAMSTQLTGAPDQDRRVRESAREDLSLDVLGSNTVEISFVVRDPALSQQVVQSTLDRFQDWIAESRSDRTTRATQEYQSQLAFYKQQADDAKMRLDDFIAQHPGLSPNSPENAQLEQLQENYESSQALYTSVAARIAETTTDSIAGSGQVLPFRVLDAPAVPETAKLPIKSIAAYIVLALGASLGLVIAGVILMTWQDRAIRTADDLAASSSLPVLAVIPRLQPDAETRPTSEAGRTADVAVA